MRVTEMVLCVSLVISMYFLGISEAFFFSSIPFKGLSLTDRDFHSKSLAKAQTQQILSLIGLNNSEGYLVFATDCSLSERIQTLILVYLKYSQD